MKIFKEFKAFAVKGNVIDMAVGVIIGTAFGKIVSSLVGDVVMPTIGFLLSGVNLSHLQWVIKEAVGDTPAVVVSYGKFLQSMLDFLIIAWAVFIAIRVFNMLHEKREAQKAEPAPTRQELLLTEIRDLLKKKN
ncbi:MAG TPA: large-conductance mechanosensitive channel protein MscL [Gammaproteobacteria bacterium]|nr:large-conductance mechanosensitive channel protein MscL [Gammaproteobacteria bacterium]